MRGKASLDATHGYHRNDLTSSSNNIVVEILVVLPVARL